MTEKSIAEVAFENARKETPFIIVAWNEFAPHWREWYDKFTAEAIAEHERREPPLMTGEFWMALFCDGQTLMDGDLYFDYGWHRVPEQDWGKGVYRDRACRRLVRVPVQPASDGGWVKLATRRPMVDDADDQGHIEYRLQSGKKGFHDWGFLKVSGDPVIWWRTPTPPPVIVPDPMDAQWFRFEQLLGVEWDTSRNESGVYNNVEVRAMYAGFKLAEASRKEGGV